MREMHKILNFIYKVDVYKIYVKMKKVYFL